jgi:hypothetical protein
MPALCGHPVQKSKRKYLDKDRANQDSFALLFAFSIRAAIFLNAFPA